MWLRTLPDFEYVSPGTVAEACSFLREYQGRAKVLAGGTDLLVNMKYRTVAPELLIGLKNVAGLDGILFNEKEGLRIGALATHESIADSPIVKEKFGALSYACSQVGTPQIRAMGTIGGNVCNASPSADTLPPLLALGGVAVLSGLEGERIVTLEDFFKGPGKTVVGPQEILTEIHLPCRPARSGGVYVKLPARTAVDIAAVCVAVSIAFDADGRTCREVKIVLGAVAPTPIRARKAEEILEGAALEDNLIEKAAAAACEEARPISDLRGSADYRTDMVRVLTKEAIVKAAEQSRKDEDL